jgi:hypothetical protein
MKDLALAAMIAFGTVGLCVLVYYIEVVTHDKKQMKKGMHFNAWTGTWDTKPNKAITETIRKFK